MSPIRILAAATAIEACFLAGFLALAGLGGALLPSLDLLNAAAPATLLLAVFGICGALASLAKGRFRDVCVALAVFGCVQPAILIARGRPPVRSDPAAAGTGIRVIAANAYDLNDRPFTATRALALARADIMLIQETESIDRASALLARIYPFRSECPASDVRIWSKTRILDQGCGLEIPGPHRPNWGASFAWARTVGPGGRPLVVATAHIARPTQPDRQARERRALALALERLAGPDIILAGDFNTAPWTFAMERQDRLFAPLVRRTGFQASWPARIGATGHAETPPLLSIDHLYASPGLTTVALRRFRLPGSDHFGTEAVLAAAPKGK